MDQFHTVLGAVVPVFGVVVAGLLFRKFNWLTEEADQSLLRININVLYPCLILDSALGNPALARWSNLVLPPLVGLATVCCGLLLAVAAGRLARIDTRAARGTFAVTVGIYNYAYVPLPLTLLLFGSGTAGVLFVHNVGVEVGMWTLGVALLSGRKPGRDWRKLINAPLLAIALALILNALGLNAARLPRPLLTIIHWLAASAIPMALLLIGAVIADHLHEFRAVAGGRVIVAAVALRLGVLPLLFLLLARYLPASIELKRVMVIEAAMPSAVFPIVMSRHYGGDPPTALRVVISTSLVGLVTIPLWIRFGLRFVGLH
jgi:predicted permease